MQIEIARRLGRGRRLYREGKLDKALPHLVAVLEVDDERADVHVMVGVIECQAGRNKRAQEHFERALALDPHCLEAALNLALCHQQAGRYELARRAYLSALEGEGSPKERVLAAVERTVRGRLAEVHRESAEAYAAAGELSMALVHFDHALALRDDLDGVRLRRAVVLRELGRVDEALGELEGLCARAPKEHAARIQLGLTLWIVGNRQRARTEWLRVIVEDPTQTLASFYLSAVPK